MPVRDKIIDRILRFQGRKMSFNSVTYTAKVDGATMPMDKFYRDVWAPVDELYVEIIDHIDWNRVFLEATQRHHELDHEDSMYYGMICEECLNEALLADTTFVSWKRQPLAPRTCSRLRNDEDD